MLLLVLTLPPLVPLIKSPGGAELTLSMLKCGYTAMRLPVSILGLAGALLKITEMTLRSR